VSDKLDKIEAFRVWNTGTKSDKMGIEETGAARQYAASDGSLGGIILLMESLFHTQLSLEVVRQVCTLNSKIR